MDARNMFFFLTALAAFAAPLALSSCDAFGDPARGFMEEQTARAAVTSERETDPEDCPTAADGYLCLPSGASCVVKIALDNERSLEFTPGESVKISLPNLDEEAEEKRTGSKVDSSLVTVRQISADWLAVTYPAQFLQATKNGGDITPEIWLCHPSNEAFFGTFQTVKIRSDDRPPKIRGVSAFLGQKNSAFSLAIDFPSPTGSEIKFVSINGEKIPATFDSSSGWSFSGSSLSPCASTANQDSIEGCESDCAFSPSKNSFSLSGEKKSEYKIALIDKWQLASEEFTITVPEGVLVYTSAGDSSYHSDRNCAVTHAVGAVKVVSEESAKADGKNSCVECFGVGVSRIEITTMPSSVPEFFVGDTADLDAEFAQSGLQATVYFENGATSVVGASALVFSAIDTSAAGTKEISVSYLRGGKTTTAAQKLSALVKKHKIISVTADAKFTAQTYYADDTVDESRILEGFEITASYDDKKTASVKYENAKNSFSARQATAGNWVVTYTQAETAEYEADSSGKTLNVSVSRAPYDTLEISNLAGAATTKKYLFADAIEKDGVSATFTRKTSAQNVRENKTGKTSVTKSLGEFEAAPYNATVTFTPALAPETAGAASVSVGVTFGAGGWCALSTAASASLRVTVAETVIVASGESVYHKYGCSDCPTGAKISLEAAQKQGKAKCKTCYNIALSSVDVTAQPTALPSFMEGSSPTDAEIQSALGGLELTKTFADNSTEKITLTSSSSEWAKISWSAIDTSAAGNQNVTITYAEGGQNFTARTKVRVTITALGTVATPQISVEGNIVTITCADIGAEIFYTTDGGAPTGAAGATCFKYDNANKPDITNVATAKIKAIATKSGMKNSAEAEAEIFTVEFDIDGGTIFGGAATAQKIQGGKKAAKPAVGIEKAHQENFDGATGIWVDSAGVAFDFTKAVAASVTLKPKWTALGVSANPSIDWRDDTTNFITMSATALAEIFYTTNGGAPTTTAGGACVKYSAPFDASSLNGATVKAIAKESGKEPSTPATEFNVEIFTVTFDIDDGTVGAGSAPATQKIHSGGKASEPDSSAFSKTDAAGKKFDFAGWFKTNSAGAVTGSEFDFTQKITADTALKAKWNAWEDGDAPVFNVNAQNKVEITAGANAVIKYSIDGGAETNYSGAFATADKTVTISATAEYAHKNSASDTTKVHAISFDLDGGAISSASANFTKKALDGKTLSAPLEPSRDGASFAGWFETDAQGAITGSAAFNFAQAITASASLKAKWNVSQVWVSAQGNDANLGTSASPKKTLQAAYNALSNPTDAAASNKITVLSDLNESVAASAYALYVVNGAKLSIESASSATITCASGAGILCAAQDSSITLKNIKMTGGLLSAVNVSADAVVTLDSCEITNGSYGRGAVNVSGGTLKLQGACAISGNTKTNSGEALNVKLSSGRAIELSGALSGSGKIGVTTADTPTSSSPVVIVKKWDAFMSGTTPGDRIVSDKGYVVATDSNKNAALMKNSGGTIVLDLPQNYKVTYTVTQSVKRGGDVTVTVTVKDASGNTATVKEVEAQLKYGAGVDIPGASAKTTSSGENALKITTNSIWPTEYHYSVYVGVTIANGFAFSETIPFTLTE